MGGPVVVPLKPAQPQRWKPYGVSLQIKRLQELEDLTELNDQITSRLGFEKFMNVGIQISNRSGIYDPESKRLLSVLASTG